MDLLLSIIFIFIAIVNCNLASNVAKSPDGLQFSTVILGHFRITNVTLLPESRVSAQIRQLNLKNDWTPLFSVSVNHTNLFMQFGKVSAVSAVMAKLIPTQQCSELSEIVLPIQHAPVLIERHEFLNSYRQNHYAQFNAGLPGVDEPYVTTMPEYLACMDIQTEKKRPVGGWYVYGIVKKVDPRALVGHRQDVSRHIKPNGPLTEAQANFELFSPIGAGLLTNFTLASNLQYRLQVLYYFHDLGQHFWIDTSQTVSFYVEESSSTLGSLLSRLGGSLWFKESSCESSSDEVYDCSNQILYSFKPV